MFTMILILLFYECVYEIYPNKYDTTGSDIMSVHNKWDID